MMPTHIITVQDLRLLSDKKVEHVANPFDSDEDVIRLAKETYGRRLISVHKVKYEVILTQVF